MRPLATLLVVLLATASALRADDLKPDQLKKAYEDTLVQLKAAQDRKAELAKENDSLTAKVDDLKKQLAVSQTEIESLKREMADTEERTFFLRAYHAAWQNFLNHYPEVMARWRLYLGNSVLTLPQECPEINSEWCEPITG